jgi:hypothetical protein
MKPFSQICLPFLTVLVLSILVGRQGLAAPASQEVTFRLPSTLTMSASRSSTETKSLAAGLRLVLPRNFWLEAAADQATETSEDLETETLGTSVSFGTDPLEDLSFDLGVDGFGVTDQYFVREGRVRLTAMPTSVLGWNNPGIELALEYRQAGFEFKNTPNPIFTSSTVNLEARTLRTEFGFYMLSPWTVRIFFERVSQDQGFQELNRPLAPLFIPETAISTAISWPRDEDGLSLSYSARKWGARIAASRKVAAITLDKTFTASLAVDYRWTRKVSTVVRYANSKSENDSTLPAIDSLGFELAYSFY